MKNPAQETPGAEKTAQKAHRNLMFNSNIVFLAESAWRFEFTNPMLNFIISSWNQLGRLILQTLSVQLVQLFNGIIVVLEESA